MTTQMTNGVLRVAKRATAGLCVALASATMVAAQSEPTQGGTAVLAIAGEPQGLNPAITTSVPEQIIGCMIYEGLTRVVGVNDIQPLLAESWEVSEDGLLYTFKLRDAQWQDGTPFTSADVKYSLLEVNSKLTPAFSAGAGKAIETIETPSPSEVVIKMKRPFGPLLRSLGCLSGGAILPKHVFEGTDVLNSDASTQFPVGTGPFKLGDWQRGQYLRLARNDLYWKSGQPYLDEVLVQAVPQASSRTQALQAGQIDYVPYFYLANNDIEQLRANPNVSIVPASLPPSQDMLFFNLRNETLANEKVRQALMMATDREFLLQNGWLGFGEVANAPFNKQLDWAANPDIDYNTMYAFNVEKANQLLDEAGVPRGENGIRFDFRLVFVSDEVDFPRVALAIKQMWAEVGVNVILEGFDRPTTTTKVFTEFDFDGHLNGYTSFGDPALGLARIFVTSAIGRPFGNPAGYSNPEIDSLFEKAEASANLEERGKVYQEIQAILAKELPVLTLHERTQYDAYSANLKGMDDDTYLKTMAGAYFAE